MGTHLGIDEAGLGPTLGPLCWGGCRWTHEGAEDSALWQRLAPLVIRPGEGPGDTQVMLLGDSKKVHSGVHRLAKLEREVLTWVGWATSTLPKSVADLWAQLVGRPSSTCSLTGVPQPPWFELALQRDLPLRATRGELEDRVQRLARKAQAIGLTAPKLRARVLSAPAFNAELLRIRALGGTKNNLAIHHAGSLALELEDGPGPIDGMVFDKMGARNSYAEQLQLHWPNHSIKILGEAKLESSYALQSSKGSATHCRFVARSESQYPSVALAACIAKYMREVVVDSFQRHFSQRYPEVRPCAGYPQDARRFLEELKAQGAPELLSSALPTWIRRG